MIDFPLSWLFSILNETRFEHFIISSSTGFIKLSVIPILFILICSTSWGARDKRVLKSRSDVTMPCFERSKTLLSTWVILLFGKTDLLYFDASISRNIFSPCSPKARTVSEFISSVDRPNSAWSIGSMDSILGWIVGWTIDLVLRLRRSARVVFLDLLSKTSSVWDGNNELSMALVGFDFNSWEGGAGVSLVAFLVIRSNHFDCCSWSIFRSSTLLKFSSVDWI